MASVHDHDNDAAFGKELLVYNRPPLWQVMRDAFDTAPMPLTGFRNCDDISRHFMAAEIRAVADAIPEVFYGANGVKAWLLEEADRAERSDG